MAWIRSVAVFAVLAGLAVGATFAQEVPVRLELGFRGAVVQEAWNPLRLTYRDLPSAELELAIDQGTLRSGEIPIVYRVELPASSGLTVFEDDVYLPRWVTFTWRLRTAERTIASGSFDPRAHDDRPLFLLLSAEPGRWIDLLPEDARLVDIAAGDLPTRAAAYQGVRALIIDGSAAVPEVGAVATAAAAGVAVVLAGGLPPSHAEMSRLAAGNRARIGAGWVVVAEPDRVLDTLREHEGFPVAGAAASLLEASEAEGPQMPSRYAVTGIGAAFAVAILALLRFGGAGGTLAALVVAVLAALTGWVTLRPADALAREDRSVVVGSGGLAVVQLGTAYRSLPGGPLLLEVPARPTGLSSYETGPRLTRIELKRWHPQSILGRPALAQSPLAWQAERLVNVGATVLEDVLVVGLGPQPDLRPGSAVTPARFEESPFPAAYGDLIDILPAGTAVARSGNSVVVALREQPGGGL